MGHAAVMQVLLDRGAEIDLRDFESRTPLHYAAWAGQPSAARVLVERGAELEARDEKQCTPLHLTIRGGPRWALACDQAAVADLLIAAGGDVNATNPLDMNRYTPLHACVHEGVQRLATARRLLAAGADPAVVDPESKLTPAGVAAAFVRLGHGEYQAYVDVLAKP
jgi:ankyrin repeat protein